jgi:hypothetical protein
VVAEEEGGNTVVGAKGSLPAKETWVRSNISGAKEGEESNSKEDIMLCWVCAWVGASTSGGISASVAWRVYTRYYI